MGAKHWRIAWIWGETISMELIYSTYWYFHSVFVSSTNTVWRLSSLFLDRNFFWKKETQNPALVLALAHDFSSASESQSGWGWQGPSDHLVQPLAQSRGSYSRLLRTMSILKVLQILQSIFKGWRLDNLSGQLVSVLDHPQSGSLFFAFSNDKITPPFYSVSPSKYRRLLSWMCFVSVFC